MPALTLDYRHCDRKRPRFIKHSEVEAIALMARQQLVASTIDALSLALLRDVTLEGALNLSATGGTLSVSGLSASSISAGRQRC